MINWKSHVTYIVSKAGRRSELTTYSANKIFKSFVLPIFYYCACTWACCNRNDNNALECLHRRAARIILKTSGSDVALESLKWDSLENRCNMHILKLINKCLKGLMPQYFEHYLTYNRGYYE